MRKAMTWICLAGAGIAIIACSGSLTREFHTNGLRQPAATCEHAPDKLGIAERLKPFREKSGCGIANPWKVSALSGVSLAPAAKIDCGVANAFNGWLNDIAQPAAVKYFGEKITRVKVAASYACRARNNKRGAKLSEHGLGNAIDIASVTLADGREITVENGWNSGRKAKKFLRQIHGEACGPFKTVLGPNADRHHHNHFHFDLANRRNGSSYCR